MASIRFMFSMIREKARRDRLKRKNLSFDFPIVIVQFVQSYRMRILEIYVVVIANAQTSLKKRTKQKLKRTFVENISSFAWITLISDAEERRLRLIFMLSEIDGFAIAAAVIDRFSF